MAERITFYKGTLNGVDAMSAITSRTFPRHTHDQYGIGVIDIGGHASLSDRGQVEAGMGSLIFVNPGEVHDGRALNSRPRSWRMLYLEPTAMVAARPIFLRERKQHPHLLRRCLRTSGCAKYSMLPSTAQPDRSSAGTL
jgi:hypothetical protein